MNTYADLKNNDVGEALPKDALINLSILKRSMAATIVISPPENGGNPPDSQAFAKKLEDYKIICGVEKEVLDTLAKSPVYDKEFTVAKGTEAISGQDGEVIYHVNTGKSSKPREYLDGTVDYKDLGGINQAREGMLLAEKTLPQDGTDGFDIYGNVLKATKGKSAVLRAGKNTRLSEDGLCLYAQKDGHVQVVGGAIGIMETYVVSEDVSSATGNIDFIGNVSVGGSVKEGFVIKAGGSITVRKACEAAVLIAGGDISIGEGINKGKLEAGGEIKCKYIQACEVVSEGNIFSEAIINSNVKCGSTITLTGRRGSILGGSCSANTAIESMYIGSENTYLSTRVEVGLDAHTQRRLQDAPKELDASRKLSESVTRAIDMLTQLDAANRLDSERKKQLADLKYTAAIETEKIPQLEAELEEIKEKAKHLGYGYISAKGSVYPGVRIAIGTFQMTVNSPTGRAKFTRGEDGIETNPNF